MNKKIPMDTENKSVVKFFADTRSGEDIFEELKKLEYLYFTSYNLETNKVVTNFPKNVLYVSTSRTRVSDEKKPWSIKNIIYPQHLVENILSPWNDEVKEILKHTIFFEITSKYFNTLNVEAEVLLASIRAESDID